MTLILLTAVALAKGPSAEKVLKYVEKGDLDKAWSMCEAAVGDGGIDAGAPTEACATAALALLRAQNKDNVTADQLDSFVQRWGLTAAGKEAKELAARTRLTAAGTRIVALADVVARYPDSQAAKEATELAWTQTELIHTAGGWRAYAEQFPNAPRRTEAVENAQQAAFEEADEYNTVGSWTHFIETWPLHPRRAEAEEKRLGLQRKEAEAKGPEALAAFNAAHPELAGAAPTVAVAAFAVYVPDATGKPVEIGTSGTDLPEAQRRLWVKAPAGARINLTLDGSGGARAYDLALPVLLRDAGLDIDSVPTPSLGLSTMQDGTVAVALPAELCNPGTGELWTLSVESGDQRRNATLRPAETCLAMAGQLQPKGKKR